MSKSTEISDAPVRNKNRLVRNAALAGVGLVALFGAVKGIGVLNALDDQGRADQNRRDQEAIVAIQADGFTPDTAPNSVWKMNDGKYSLLVNLGSCSMKLTADPTEDGDHVTDVHDYSFSGYAMATTKYATGMRGKLPYDYQYTDGEPVTFHVENLEELKANVLGSNPCLTLGGTYAPPTTVEH